MAKFNAPMQSMTWEEDYTDLNAGDIVDGTWYEATNYSGMGRLSLIGIHGDTALTTIEMRITTDGNLHTMGTALVAPILNMHAGSVTGLGLSFPFSLEFLASLVVEGRRNGDTNDIEIFTSYGILSEEFKREIIPAGQPVPDRSGKPRPKTYPFDVMLVWFRGANGISNKVEFLRSEIVDLNQAKVLTPSYNLTVKGPRHNFTQSNFTGTKQIVIDGIYYEVSINNGIIELSSIPYLITNNAFWDRFTTAEQEVLIVHPNVKVQVLLYQIRIRPKINLRWNKLITALNALESAGIIGTGRAAEILEV